GPDPVPCEARMRSAAATTPTAGLGHAFVLRAVSRTGIVQPQSTRHKTTDQDDDCDERDEFIAHENPLPRTIEGGALTIRVNIE
ncbi:hypothetical protein ACWGKQ_50450, partial [Streptomyces sp. NPDC054770]